MGSSLIISCGLPALSEPAADRRVTDPVPAVPNVRSKEIKSLDFPVNEPWG
jgi:hypothetical protein